MNKRIIPENLQIWNDKQIIIALSGGVDSAVAALMLKDAGAQLRAVFMKNWDDEDTEAGCHDKQDLIAAAAAADALGLDFDVVNFTEEYRRRVFEPFLAELRAGRTPNPDILCNSEIKFAAFYNYARDNGAAAIATGHYARNDCFDGRWRLRRAEDAAKDQTYFLHRLNAEQLAGAVFPLGHLHKADVREKARAAGLENWARKDSTGICFIGERDFPEFLSRYIEKTPGDIVDETGRAVGRHDGLAFYTIGQRRGLHIGGAEGPWFVFGKDRENNFLQVVRDKDHPLLFCQTVQIENPHWIAGESPPLQWVYSAKLRYGQTPDSCTLVASTAAAATLIFAKPQRAATPGQYAVLYDGNVCLGGGVIS